MSSVCSYYHELRFITMDGTGWCVMGQFATTGSDRPGYIEVSMEEFDAIMEIYGRACDLLLHN